MTTDKKKIIITLIILAGAIMLFQNNQKFSGNLYSITDFREKYGPVIGITNISSYLFDKSKVIGGEARIAGCEVCVPEDDRFTFIPKEAVISGLKIGSCPAPPTCEQYLFQRNIDYSDLSKDQQDALKKSNYSFMTSFEIDPSILLQGIALQNIDQVTWYQEVECTNSNDCFQEQDILRLRSSLCDTRQGSSTIYQCVSSLGGSTSTGSSTEPIDTNQEPITDVEIELKEKFPIKGILILIAIGGAMLLLMNFRR